MLAEGLSGRTARSLVDRESLRADLADTRRRGYSISDEDVTPGVAAIGAPIFGADGQVVAGMSIGGLLPRLLPPRPGHVSRLLAACEQISRRLGYQRS